MAIERAKACLQEFGAERRVLELGESSATVELAAAALGCEPRRIAKTLALYGETGAILVVAAGDARIDNRKFRDTFGVKAKMLSAEDTEKLVGHAPGGVCPFGVEEGAMVCLDVSLRRFDTVYPAAGSSNSAIRVTIPELEQFSHSEKWVDVCKDWGE